MHFLDVDCIVSHSLTQNLLAALTHNLVISSKVRYLEEVPRNGRYETLSQGAISHPTRATIATDDTVKHTKFWSLVFAIKRSSFDKIGQFDVRYTGYGAEDTDFAERFNKAGIRLLFVDDEVLHQYHDKYNPPINYLKDICQNANLFYSIHGYFPMRKWLVKFADMGLVQFNKHGNQFDILRLPSESERQSCFSKSPY